jgi:hypothetical protein
MLAIVEHFDALRTHNANDVVTRHGEERIGGLSKQYAWRTRQR